MDSSHLTPEQIERLRATVGRYLRFLNRLCGRMQQLSFPLDDPLCHPAHRARDAAQDLYTAAHYCGCDSQAASRDKFPLKALRQNPPVLSVSKALSEPVKGTYGVNSIHLTFLVSTGTLSAMARPLRIEFEGASYHVTARGNERRAIYRDDSDRQRFLQTVGEACGRFGLVVHAYCLMPNHYHLLATTPRANLSRAVGWLQTAYSIRFNRRHGRSGHLVQGRFKAHLVDADSYARQLVRYVHLNPVRPRDRRKPVPAERRPFFDSYLWSSHRAYAGTSSKDQVPEWLSLDWLGFWDDGSNRKAKATRAYVSDVSACFGEPIRSPFEDLRGGLVLGTEALWKKAQSLVSGRSDVQTLRWTRGQSASEIQRRVAMLIKNEPDQRVKMWARVRLGGEPLTALAKELGYADGSGVHQTVRRLEAKAGHDPALKERLESLKHGFMSNVRS